MFSPVPRTDSWKFAMRRRPPDKRSASIASSHHGWDPEFSRSSHECLSTSLSLFAYRSDDERLRHAAGRRAVLGDAVAVPFRFPEPELEPAFDEQSGFEHIDVLHSGNEVEDVAA